MNGCSSSGKDVDAKDEKRGNEKKIESIKSRRRYLSSRNSIVFQEAIFIYELNKLYDMIVAKPIKRSIVTEQYVRVLSVNINGEDVQVEKCVETRCQSRLANDKCTGIKEESAIRRYTLNKTTETHHFLIDTLLMNGFMFNSKSIAGRNGSIKIENVTEIYKDDELLYDNESIMKFGEEINKILSNLTDNVKQYSQARGYLCSIISKE